MGGGNAQAKDFGDAKNLIAAFITILIIVVIEVWTKGFLRSISVLIGLIVGTLIASCMGLVSLKPVAEASWFHLPQFFYFGVPEFEWSSCLTMIIIALVSLVESTGVFFAIGDLLHQDITEEDLKRLSCRRISTNLRRAFQHLPLHYFFSKCRLASIIRH